MLTMLSFFNAFNFVVEHNFEKDNLMFKVALVYQTD